MALKKPTKRKNPALPEQITAQNPAVFEVIAVDSHSVKCDGGKGALGHPRVFLEIPPTKSDVTCPYCSRMFVYAGHH